MYAPKNNIDYLLGIRAEAVSSNPRLNRVFYKLREYYGKKWNFSNYFNDTLFKRYRNNLSGNMKEACSNVVAGFININEVNGYCTKTDFGNLIFISYSLQYFLYYMNVWEFASEFQISDNDKFCAFNIATRTMLGSEALDFELDSRGKLPKRVRRVLTNATNLQLEFIIGHEYAHHYLGHLDDTHLINFPAINDFDKKNVKVYTYSDKIEIEADYHSVAAPAILDQDRSDLLSAACHFFIYMDLLECVIDYIYPPAGRKRSHPLPLERLHELRRKFPADMGISSKQVESLIARNERIKQSLLTDFLPFQVDELEKYGSVYLPSYKKEEKLDRLDF